MKAGGRGTKSVRNCARSRSGLQRVIIGHRIKTAGGGETLFTPGALWQGRDRLRDIRTDKHEWRGHRDFLDTRPRARSIVRAVPGDGVTPHAHL